MIDLYAAGTSNGMRARIGLEECGLAYNFHPSISAKASRSRPRSRDEPERADPGDRRQRRPGTESR